MKDIRQDTKFIMDKYHIKAKKLLGQNFLISQDVVEKIVESSQIQKEDLVIEIGPGLGTLTQFLLEKAGKVICIELDKKMIKILQDRFCLYDNFELINEDVLKVDLKSLIAKEKEKSNLPYYITTPIIMKLLEEELDLDTITVMIQKEVADRLVAIPGEKDAGAITYSVYYYSEAKAILEVPHDCFIPEPEVTSKVIQLKIRKQPPVEVKNKEVMFRIIKSAFMQRRKTLLNSLTNARVFLNKEEGSKILEELGLNVNIRAESLTLQNFADISNKICDISEES